MEVYGDDTNVAKRDQNYVPTMIAVSSVDGKTPVVLYADPDTHRLYVDMSTASLSFINLSDVPGSYVDQAGKILRVNSSEDGIEFATLAGGGDFLADGSVPMTGDMDLNGNDLNNTNSIQFDTTPTAVTAAEGLLQWNATDGTLNLGMSNGDITQQIGQELFIKVWNDTGSTITNGSAVYFNGRQGNRPKIVLARGDSSSTCMVMGLATQDIATGGEGFITTFGYVRQIKTDYSTWAEGQPLYLSTTTAGALTNVEPDAPHHSDLVGYIGVVGGAGIGSIFVSINRHKELQTLSDINGTVLASSGQFPVWDDTNGYFDFTENINNYKQAQFYAGTMTVNTGTLNTGTVTDLQALGGTDVNIQEVSGADPLRVTFNFTGVTRMTAFTFFGYYAGGSEHQIEAEIYNHGTTNWDSLGAIGSEGAKKWYSFPIHNTSSYISAGAVVIRLRHVQNGNAAHALILDYLDVDFGSAGGSSTISASSVTFIPSGNISATNVASAIIELDNEKAPALGTDDNYVTDAEKTAIGTIGNKLNIADIDDTPVNGETSAPISSNWAYDHENDTSTHGVTGNVLGTSDTQTVTNKRVNPRVSSTTTASTLTPDVSSYNVYFRTTQTEALTIGAPTGTPVTGETIIIYVDSAAAQTLTINSTYKVFGAAFPATTTAGKTFMMSAQYNGTDWKTLWANAQ